MSNPIQLSLPLSATALRLGADFLTLLAEHAAAIAEESNPTPVYKQVGHVVHATGVTHLTNVQAAGEPEPVEGGGLSQAFTADHHTTLAEDVATAEAETEAARIQRLHGNVGSAGMEPAPVPEPEMEMVVTGVERNEEYTGDLAAFEHSALTDAGWTDDALIAANYLQQVFELRPKPSAPTASAAIPAPPAAPAPNAPATSGAVELDADGLPWDERIHSKAAEPKAATGKWKTRKNLAAGYKEQIEAELRAAMGTTASPSAPAQAPAAPSAPPAAPPAPVAAAAPAAPTPPSAPGAMDFPAFTRWVLGYVNSKAISQTDVALVIQEVGLAIMPDLAKFPDKIAPAVQILKDRHGLK